MAVIEQVVRLILFWTSIFFCKVFVVCYYYYYYFLLWNVEYYLFERKKEDKKKKIWQDWGLFREIAAVTLWNLIYVYIYIYIYMGRKKTTTYKRQLCMIRNARLWMNRTDACRYLWECMFLTCNNKGRLSCWARQAIYSMKYTWLQLKTYFYQNKLNEKYYNSMFLPK